MDIVVSSMFSMCDIDRSYNSILKITWCHWFYYPKFNLSRNGIFKRAKLTRYKLRG